MYVGASPACTSVPPHAWSAQGGQKRVLDPLELKLEPLVRFLGGAGNSGKAARLPNW